jgi:hypothetical protein
LKDFFGQQADVLCEHREEAAHQKHRDVLRRIFLLLQRKGDLRQPLGDVSRHLCRGLRRIERCRIEPDLLETFTDFGLAKVLKIDSKVLAIGKLRIILSLPGKIRINLDAVSDVANHNERRPSVRRG